MDGNHKYLEDLRHCVQISSPIFVDPLAVLITEAFCVVKEEIGFKYIERVSFYYVAV